MHSGAYDANRFTSSSLDEVMNTFAHYNVRTFVAYLTLASKSLEPDVSVMRPLVVSMFAQIAIHSIG